MYDRNMPLPLWSSHNT